jgi:integrase
MDRFAAALGEVNGRLKAAGFRCRIEHRGKRLSLVATLPERVGTGRRQQRIALGVEATLAGLGAAESQAMNLGLQIRQQTFTWAAWAPPEDETKPDLAHFHATAIRIFTERFGDRADGGKLNWKSRWRPALSRVPTSGELSAELLLGVIEAMPANSAMRRSYGQVITTVAGACGLNCEPLRVAKTGYSVRRLQPRDIPADDQIVEVWKLIKNPEWQWVFGMCAVYGLRPHEVQEVKLTPEYEAKVGDSTKTGYRVVWPAPQAWVEKFDLPNGEKPKCKPDQFTNRANIVIHTRGPSPFALYNLRHAYAIRLLLAGVPSSLAARLMGHSVAIHERVYQRWLDAAELTKLRGGFNL